MVPSLAALLLFAFAQGIAMAQSPSAAAPTVNEIARRIDAHYNRLQSLQASFEEKYDGLGMSRSESGTMLLRKPGKMRWDYASSPGKIFVLDGKYACFYTPGDTQVQRIPASQLDDLRSPLRFLLGHTKIESELQNLKLAPADPSINKPGYTLQGVPKGQQKRIARLTLSVTASGAIEEIVIQEVDGARTQFRFTGEVANPSIPEGLFHFTPPPGVPVVDSLPPI